MYGIVLQFYIYYSVKTGKSQYVKKLTLSKNTVVIFENRIKLVKITKSGVWNLLNVNSLKELIVNCIHNIALKIG